MGAKIPIAVRETKLSRLLEEKWLEQIYRGKVRDTYELPGYPGLLLVVATDRLSIFDFVLNCLVPRKGEILTALTVFWLTNVLKDIKHHLVAHGKGIDYYFSLERGLRNNPELQARGIIVRRLNIEPVECVARGYLAGSAWAPYQETGTAYGYKLPPLLHPGSRLPQPIFTPTTKSESGHDEPLSTEKVNREYGPELERLTLEIYNQGIAYAEEQKIIIADTKFEFGRLGPALPLTLADEVLTPDSSRFWDKTEWQQAAQKGEAPRGYDKEPVRQWGKTIETPFGVTGINNLSPENPKHITFVQRLKVPKKIISSTAERYREIARRLIGRDVS